MGYALTGRGEDKVKATACLKKYPDGKGEILVANTEIGQGARTALTKIVSDTLGIPPEKVIHNYTDTSRVPDSGATVASRTTMVAGKLLEQAARKMEEDWDKKQEFAAFETFRRPQDLEWDEKNFHGDPYLDYSWEPTLWKWRLIHRHLRLALRKSVLFMMSVLLLIKE